MKAAVVVFPGINRERDMARALTLVSGCAPAMVWHADTALPAGKREDKFAALAKLRISQAINIGDATTIELATVQFARTAAFAWVRR